MLRGERTATIDRPASNAFEFVTNMDNLARWEGRVVESEMTNGGKITVSEHLLFVGTYAIQEGTFAAFNVANEGMGHFVEANEPRLISWHTYVNEERTEATTIMVHPDSESLEYHLQVAGSRVREGVQMVQTKRIELYGKASDRLLEQLRSISHISGSWPVIVKSHLDGFPDCRAGA